MKIATLEKESYTGGYHAFKKILRIEEDGSKVISLDGILNQTKSSNIENHFQNERGVAN